MANYLSDRTGASIDEVLDNADAGNIGKTSVSSTGTDLNEIENTGFYRVSPSALNNPLAQDGMLIVAVGSFSGNVISQIFTSSTTNRIYTRTKFSTWRSWQEIYHTGNTGVVEFNKPANSVSGSVAINIGAGGGSAIETSVDTTNLIDQLKFFNANGKVGSIRTAGSTTEYQTSSDPRLKDFAEAPTDEAINEEFNKLFSCFRTFKWKADPEGALVWGFDAHACIDAKIGLGGEGEGPRDSEIGEVYETTPAVTESRVVMDSEGNPTSEVEEVVITEAVDKKVSPAGVDQAKAVPILLAKIEQLERRLSAANL